MTKKLIPLFAAIIFAATTNAQPKKTGDIVITPGVGVGLLKLGMSESAAYKILGGNFTWKSYKDELRVFKGYGDVFSIDSIPQFVLGFDSCGAYGNSLPVSMPVYSLYFSEHKLVYITVTSYGARAAQVKKVVLKNGIRFYNSRAACEAKMKSKYLAIRYSDYDDHVYYKEGLEFTYDNKKLTTIGVFVPSPGFLQRMAARSYDIQQEFGDVE